MAELCVCVWHHEGFGNGLCGRHVAFDFLAYSPLPRYVVGDECAVDVVYLARDRQWDSWKGGRGSICNIIMSGLRDGIYLDNNAKLHPTVLKRAVKH